MRYKYNKIIAQNESSEVVLATADLGSTTRDVILKTVLPKITEEIYTRLYLAKQLKHPCIQQLIDFGECTIHSQKKGYVTYPHLQGWTLSQILKRFSDCKLQIPIPFIINLSISICEGLHYTHTFFDSINNDFIPHGSLSPDFIHIAENGNVTISDMGIGDVVKYIYNGSELIDKPIMAFAHPNIKNGKPWKRSYEIFALGKIMNSMLTDAIDEKNKQKKQSENGRNIASHNDLQTIVNRMITKGYCNVGEVREILNKFIKDKDIRLNQKLTARMIHVLYDNPYSSEIYSCDFWTEQKSDIRNTAQVENIDPVAYETETGKFLIEECDFNPVSENEYQIKHDETTIHNECKGIEPECENIQAFSHLLKKTTISDQLKKEPFANLLKKEEGI